MSIVSKLVGEVIDVSPRDFARISGETFKAITVQLLDAKIDVVISEFVAKESYEGKVEITGYLASKVQKGTVPLFFIFANEIVEVPEDTAITNKVQFRYKVTKVSKFKVNSRGVDLLPMVAADYTAHQTTSVIYLCVRGLNARKLKDKKPGYYVAGEGYLKQYRDIYEIITTEVTVEE